MTLSNGLKLLVFSSVFVAVSASSYTNFTQCLDTFRANGNATGGTDYFGRPVNDSRDAVALTYGECKSLCGTKQEAFSWSTFSQQFSAWLLPWLALVSQLPFGAESRLDNLISGESPSWYMLVGPAIFLPPCTSRSHRWISNPRIILPRPHRPQHPLGERPLFRHRVPQPQARCQGSHLPPAGPTPGHHPRGSTRISHSPPRERRVVGIPGRQTRTNVHLDNRRGDLDSVGDRRLRLHDRRLHDESGKRPQLERSGRRDPLAVADPHCGRLALDPGLLTREDEGGDRQGERYRLRGPSLGSPPDPIPAQDRWPETRVRRLAQASLQDP